MNRWLVYILGIITGIVLTFVFALCIAPSNNSKIQGLELFEKPGDYMDYSRFEVFQVVESGYALANTNIGFGITVLIIPNKHQHFYDEESVVLKDNQRAQRIGTYRYTTNNGFEKTVPAILIVDDVN